MASGTNTSTTNGDLDHARVPVFASGSSLPKSAPA